MIPIEGRVWAGATTVTVRSGFNRPGDTTQYTINDNVGPNATTGGAQRLEGCARVEGGTGILYSALMFISTDAATNPNFDLVLFDTNNLTVAADNAAGTITDAEAEHCVAVITFDGTNANNVCTVGPNLIIGCTSIGQAFKCAPDSTDLWYVIVDRGGYTPASAERIEVKINIFQD